MAKTTHKKGTVALTVSSNQLVDYIDITSCNGASVQLNGIAGTAGSMKLQHSNDGTNWLDIPSATLTLVASSANIINQSALYTAHVRLLVTLSGGAGSYNYYILGKER